MKNMLLRVVGVTYGCAMLFLCGCVNDSVVQTSIPESTGVPVCTEISSTTTTEQPTTKLTTKPTTVSTTTKHTTTPTTKLTTAPTTKLTTKSTAAPTTATTTTLPKSTVTTTTTTAAQKFLYKGEKAITPYAITHTQKESKSAIEADKYKAGNNQWLFDLIVQYFPEETFSNEWKIEISTWRNGFERSGEDGEEIQFVSNYSVELYRYINDIKTDYYYRMRFDKESDTYTGDTYICDEIQVYAPIYDPATMKKPHKLTTAKEKAFCEQEWERIAAHASSKWGAEPHNQTSEYRYYIAEDRLVFETTTPYGRKQANGSWLYFKVDIDIIGTFEFD